MNDCFLVFIKSFSLEQFSRVFTGIYQCLNLIHYALTVFRISDAEPLAGSIQYFNSGSSVINQFIYHQWDEELALQVFHILRIAKESLEELKELRALGYDGITIGVETGDDESLTFMNKGFQSKDVLEQCRKLDEAGISYNFFYLTGIYGAGRGEVGAKKTAMLFNQLNPKIIESSMLTIYKTSELYQEIQKGNWKEESEIEKLIELKTLVENLTINTRIVTDGASNLIQVRGNLPADKKKLIKHLEYQISNADEASLREYRVNLRHL